MPEDISRAARARRSWTRAAGLMCSMFRRDPAWPWARTVLLVTLVLGAVMFAYGPRAFYWNRPPMAVCGLLDESRDWYRAPHWVLGLGMLLFLTNVDIFIVKGTWSRLPASVMLAASVFLVAGPNAAMGITLWFFFWEPWAEAAAERPLLRVLFRLAGRVHLLKWLGGLLIVWGLRANSTPLPLALAVCVTAPVAWIAGLRWLEGLRSTAEHR